MKNAGKESDNLIYLKLLSKAAETAKSDRAKMDIITNNVEILVNRGDLGLIQRLYMDMTQNRKYGAANWQCAAIFARRNSTKKATKHLLQGDIWNEWRQSLDKDELHNLDINFDDRHIAASCETYLRLEGIVKARWAINRWKPKKIRLGILKELVHRIATTAEDSEISNWAKQVTRVDACILIADEALRTNKQVDIDHYQLLKRADVLIQRGIKLSKKLGPSVVNLYEDIFAKCGLPPDLNALVAYFEPAKPEHTPYFTDYALRDKGEVEKMDTLLRFLSLQKHSESKQLKPNHLYSKRIRRRIKEEESDGRKRSHTIRADTDKFYNLLIPFYHFRARLISNNQSGNIREVLKKEFGDIFPKEDMYHYRRHDYPQLHGHCVNRLVDLANYDREPVKFLEDLIDLIPDRPIIITMLGYRLAYFSDAPRLVYQLLSKLDQYACDNTLKATERIEVYEHCIQISLRMKDQDEAELYFQKAVEVSNKIDLEVFDQMPALSYITEQVIVDKQSKLAFDLAKFSEHSSLILSGYDNFPWNSSVSGIRNLSFTSSLAIWCRWNHRNVDVGGDAHHSFWIDSLFHLLVREKYSPSLVFALAKMNFFNYRFEELIDMVLEKALTIEPDKVPVILELLERELAVYCPLDRRKDYLKLLLPILEKHKLSDTTVYKELKKLQDFLKSIEPTSYSQITSTRETPSKNKIDLSDLINSVEPNDSFHINEILLELDGEDYYYSAKKDFLLGLKCKCAPQDYLGFLKSMEDLKVSNISQHEFEEVLKSCLMDWETKQTVRKWKKDNFTVFVKKVLLEFRNDESKLDYFDHSILLRLANQFGASRKELAEEIKGIFSSLIGIVSAEFIYQSFSTFSYLLEPEEAIEYLEWVLPPLLKDIDPEHYDGIWNETFNPPSSIEDNVALFLRYYLGHPDKQERWHVLHTLVSLVKTQGSNPILDYLIDNRNDFACQPFQHNKHIFFHLSAKLWLFVACEKIARECPNSIVNHFDSFKTEALKAENNHALIRWFARSICLELISFRPEIVTDEERVSLQTVFQSKLPKKELEFGKSEAFEEKQRQQFPFDHLDTERYWFKELAEVFGITTRSVLSISDRFICNYLKYRGNPSADNHVDVPDREYWKTSNDHGSIPQIENLRIYFEYHSMFMAGNYLLEKREQVQSDYRYDFEDWIANWGLVWKDDWCSDLRDQTPMKMRYWNGDPTKDIKWKWGITKEFINDALHENNSKEYLQVYGSCRFFTGKNYEDIRINSSFVNTKSAKSLMRALQTVRDSHNYKLPFEGEEFEIGDGVFELRPCLQIFTENESGMDDYDHLALDLDRSKILPCSDFIQRFDMVFDKQQKKGFLVSKPDQNISELTMWSDFLERKERYSYSDFGSNGMSLKIRKKELFQYLQEKGFALIRECEVSRYVGREDYDYDYEESDYGASDRYIKVYLTYADGSTETI